MPTNVNYAKSWSNFHTPTHPLRGVLWGAHRLVGSLRWGTRMALTIFWSFPRKAEAFLIASLVHGLREMLRGCSTIQMLPA
ncbi:hypothetical protein Mal52_11130 [Symmachiella dynata]|uniref:Uncharacterized protein n=1 Tax=Symmachiella dynata TaxID=2527995 RepID=A0A517ZJI0_9PLAN|nr:hypothetical protein Mal52_11130 [Symmachiella dynata]